MEELGKKQENKRLYSDNQSVIHLVKNSTFHAKPKDIDRRYHFIWSLLKNKVLRLEKMHIGEGLADMFTKVVALEKLKVCKILIGLQE